MSESDNKADVEDQTEESTIEEDDDHPKLESAASLEAPKVFLSQTKSLSTSDHEMQPTSPKTRGIKYTQSLRVKREASNKADRTGWSLGNMAKALSTGVVQGTRAVGSGVVQKTKVVGSGVVQGTKAVGTGVVQGSLAVGSGVVQGSKAVGTGVVAAGRMTKDVTIAVGKGVYHASEVVGTAAVTGVSAAGEATVSASRVVTTASVNAVMDTTKWVKEQSESFGGDDHETYIVLPGDTLESIAEIHGVTVYDLIRLNNLTRRRLIAGKQVMIPEESEVIPAHSDEFFVAKALMVFQPQAGDDELEGILRFSTEAFTFTSKGTLMMNIKPEVVAHLNLDVQETTLDGVPDLLPVNSIEESEEESGSKVSDDTPGEANYSGGRMSQRQSQCHIVEVDMATNALRRERSNTNGDDVVVILEIRASTEDNVDESSTSDSPSAKMHLFQFRFPQSDLASVHSYLELWHDEKLSVSTNFHKHLLLESTGLEDIDIDASPPMVDESSILDDRQLRELYRNLPIKIQNQAWNRVYSTKTNGFSLQNLYRTVFEEKDPFLIVIEDSMGFIFGAYLTCTPRVSEAFIGTGKSWVFSFGALEEQPKEDSDDNDASAGELELKVINPHHIDVFHWSGRNEYFFRGTIDNFMIGAGDGKFGILVDGDLHKGRIQECDTFEGWPHKEQDFVISCLECWKFL